MGIAHYIPTALRIHQQSIMCQSAPRRTEWPFKNVHHTGLVNSEQQGGQRKQTFCLWTYTSQWTHTHGSVHSSLFKLGEERFVDGRIYGLDEGKGAKLTR